MKIIIITLLIASYSYGQQYTEENGIFHYKDVVEVEKSKEDIKSIIKKWSAVNFNNSNYVTRLDTDDELVIKGSFSIKTDGVKEDIDFTMDVAFKEERYKLEFYYLSNVNNYIGIKFPITHPDKFTKEQFKSSCIEMINQMGFGKKMALKRIEKEKVFNKYYERSKADMAKTYFKVEDKIKSLALSIKNDVSNKKKDDW